MRRIMANRRTMELSRQLTYRAGGAAVVSPALQRGESGEQYPDSPVGAAQTANWKPREREIWSTFLAMLPFGQR
jgi:hypothetical protein